MKKCPLLKKPCITHECAWWVKLRGKDPQSQQEIDQYDCAIAWNVILNIENTQSVQAVTTTLDLFRKETQGQQVQINETLNTNPHLTGP